MREHYSKCDILKEGEQTLKDNEKKLAFIQARAEGKSYNTIAKELKISKSTCTRWEGDFREDIEKLRGSQIEELYTAYNMKREARIRDLGEIINAIDTALQTKDISELPTDKLLELRLKYSQELKKEYIEPIEKNSDGTLDGLLEAYTELYNESKAGRYTPAEIRAQLAILDAERATLLKAEEERQKENKNFLETSLIYKSGLLREEE